MSSRPLKRVLLDLLDSTQAAQHTLITELNDTERAAIGTPDYWSARDHVAHLTFWKQHLSLTLAALARSQTPPSKGDTEALNAQVFKEQRERPWSDILLEAEQAHAELLASVERFTEGDLANPRWFPLEGGDESRFPEDQPLWVTILSNGFWHLLEHFTQFYLDRNEVLHATQLQEVWADSLMQPGVPPLMRSIALYTLALFYATTKQGASAQEALRQARTLNHDPVMQSIVLCQLASFYATTNESAKAQEMLRQALALNPALAEFFKQDPDITSLLGE